MPKGPTPAEGVEYGLRFKAPHKNAGESIWLPDLQMAAYLVDDLSEIVTRRVSPWVLLTKRDMVLRG